MTENIDMKSLLIFISLLLYACCPLCEDLSYPSTIVFGTRIATFPHQLDQLNIKILGDDSIYVDTTVHKGALDFQAFWFDFSIDDYKKIHPKAFSIQMEGSCNGGNVVFPKMDFVLNDCYYVTIDEEEQVKYYSNYTKVLESANTNCGKLDDWFYSVQNNFQLGNRDCEIYSK